MILSAVLITDQRFRKWQRTELFKVYGHRINWRGDVKCANDHWKLGFFFYISSFQPLDASLELWKVAYLLSPPTTISSVLYNWSSLCTHHNGQISFDSEWSSSGVLLMALEPAWLAKIQLFAVSNMGYSALNSLDDISYNMAWKCSWIWYFRSVSPEAAWFFVSLCFMSHWPDCYWTSRVINISDVGDTNNKYMKIVLVGSINDECFRTVALSQDEILELFTCCSVWILCIYPIG